MGYVPNGRVLDIKTGVILYPSLTVDYKLNYSQRNLLLLGNITLVDQMFNDAGSELVCYYYKRTTAY